MYLRTKFYAAGPTESGYTFSERARRVGENGIQPT